MTEESEPHGPHSGLEVPKRLPDNKGEKIELARKIVASFSDGNTKAARNWPRGPFAYASNEKGNQGGSQ